MLLRSLQRTVCTNCVCVCVACMYMYIHVCACVCTYCMSICCGLALSNHSLCDVVYPSAQRLSIISTPKLHVVDTTPQTEPKFGLKIGLETCCVAFLENPSSLEITTPGVVVEVCLVLDFVVFDLCLYVLYRSSPMS